jgi:hypothetical protein
MRRSGVVAARGQGALVAAVLAWVGAAGCGGSSPLDALGAVAGTQGPPQVELQGTPVASYDPATGKTSVGIDLLVRDATGRVIDPAQVTFRRYVDGQPADVESVPIFKDTKLAANLTMGWVLDASYSMTTWQPPAFVAMKQAALDSQRAIRAQYQAWSAGTFQPLLGWFQDQYLCAPASAAMPDAAVLDIPTPHPGDATKLLAATAQMVDRLKAAYDAAGSHGPRDQYALVVFTDGWDNYSWHDDAAVPAKSYPATGGSFACAGPGPITLAELVAKITAFPQLKVDVIGLGNQLKASELQAIAEAGHGRVVSNPDSSQVAVLFAEVTKEFTTVRRDGITMPLPPGDYDYLETATVAGGTAQVRFRFHAGDQGAAVVPSSLSTSTTR